MFSPFLIKKNHMKKTILFFTLLFATGIGYSQVVSVSPSTFEITDQITITVNTGNKTDTDCNGMNNPNKVYMHAGAGDANNAFGFDVVGNWGQDDGVGQMVSVGGGIYTITLTPSTYFDLTSEQQSNVTQLGMVFRNESGSQELKDNGCADFFIPVGLFQLTLNTPSENTTFVTSGSSLPISATSSIAANFTLKANGSTINTQNGITSYNFSPTVNSTTSYVLEATSGSETQTKSFTAIVTPSVITEAIPSGIEEGINYDSNDNTKVTLALKAPLKDYVYVAGSFNNYNPNNTFLMKRDVTDNDLFWIELTGLTPNQPYTFQYWVVDETPISNSPSLVKTADPYSTLILDPNHDGSISSSTYPNMPQYPDGQQREVTVIETGQTAYNWVVNNFQKPKKEDLIIYEVLVRDFDSDRNFQDLIDKIDYFKSLKINAIQFMPLNEFPGNLSWGYNPSFHMALDKAYGTKNKLKEFIDLCHQNGIAVILDVVLNHAFQESPLVRMWSKNVNSSGLGPGSSENPYVNEVARHPFNVGEDMNHESVLTKNYVKRNIKYWIEEFKFDGLRWDLSKGFTQNNTGNDVGAWNAYDQSRINILQDYADYSWSLDETHYVIFEHLGIDAEESAMANYRIGDSTPKGIMFWGKMTTEYTDLVQGFSNDISRADHKTRGFNAPRLVMYPESHDEERIMYEALKFGNNSNVNHNVRNLSIAAKRMGAMAAVSYTIPGPKMIWHFSDLGMDESIWTCSNGTVQVGNDGCKLDTKPQPQWSENWLANPDRKLIYDTWSRLFDLKVNEDVFEGDFVLEGTTQSVRLYIYDDALPTSQLKNVVILANFRTIDQNIIPNFPYSGTWYNLMDDTPVTVNSTSDPILIPAGEFRIFGNQPSTLSTEDQIIKDPSFVLSPNPTRSTFQLNKTVKQVVIYNMLGKEVANFKGDFPENKPFSIQSLNRGMYIVRIVSEEGTLIKRLIKE